MPKAKKMENTKKPEYFLSFVPKQFRRGYIDIEGQKFGRLTALKYEGSNKKGCALWLCFCDCGKLKVVRGANLRSGTTKSCGCSNIKHGFNRKGKITPTYRSYTSAKSRCNNPKDTNYKTYGGRGIEFRFKSFLEFLKEVGERPDLKHTIDRIDVNGHYEKGNIRWVTAKEQRKNQRLGRFLNQTVIINGEAKNMKEWLETYNHPASRVQNRIKDGWCYPCAITIAAQIKTRKGCQHRKNRKPRPSRLIKINGQMKTIKEWSGIYGIDRLLINDRRHRGWCFSCAVTLPKTKPKGRNKICTHK
jgi:hypothetical protein